MISVHLLDLGLVSPISYFLSRIIDSGILHLDLFKIEGQRRQTGFVSS